MKEKFKWGEEEADKVDRSIRWMQREVETVKERYTNTLDAVRRLEEAPDEAENFIRLNKMEDHEEEGITTRPIYVRPLAVDYVRAIEQEGHSDSDEYPRDRDANCVIGIRGGGEHIVMHDPDAIIKTITGKRPSRWG